MTVPFKSTTPGTPGNCGVDETRRMLREDGDVTARPARHGSYKCN